MRTDLEVVDSMVHVIYTAKHTLCVGIMRQRPWWTFVCHAVGMRTDWSFCISSQRPNQSSEIKIQSLTAGHAAHYCNSLVFTKCWWRTKSSCIAQEFNWLIIWAQFVWIIHTIYSFSFSFLHQFVLSSFPLLTFLLPVCSFTLCRLLIPAVPGLVLSGAVLLAF